MYDVQEDWKNYVYAGPVTDRIANGIKHRFFLNPSAEKHYVWLAAGAYFQSGVTDHWFVSGCLRFFLGTREVGCFLFGDASSQAPPIFTDSIRPIIRIRADASGSVQPVLRYQEVQSSSASRDNLDIACFLFELEADLLHYVIEDARIQTNTIGPGVLSIRTGLRVLSQ